MAWKMISDSYTYDLSGNPQKIYFTNGSITKYVYSATGQKLRMVHYTAAANITRTIGQHVELKKADIQSTDSTDYLLGGSLVVRNGKIDKYLFDGGYAQATASGTTDKFTFYYQNKDHLGTVRETVTSAGAMKQRVNYYPFGGQLVDTLKAMIWNRDFQQYKYNGKEFDGMYGLNTYDYGARQHYPVLARWDRLDPLCEKYYNISPYAYCGNNPVNRIDPDGRDYELSIDSLNNVITITATYYASSNSYESAVQAAKIINDQSKVYSYEVDGVSYVVNFNLNVVDTGMEVAELNLAKSMDDSGYANSYQVVSDDYKTMDENTNGRTSGGQDIVVKSSRSDTETGAHEMGHTLGLLHSWKGLMTAASSSKRRSSSFTKRNIRDMIRYPIKGKRNSDAGRGVLKTQVDKKLFTKGVIKLNVK